jgi:hypothetical protein
MFLVSLTLGSVQTAKVNDHSFYIDRGVGFEDFSLLHVVQTGIGAHPVSHLTRTGGYFTVGKAVGA